MSLPICGRQTRSDCHDRALGSPFRPPVRGKRIAGTVSAWGFLWHISGTCVEDCGDSGVRGAFVLAVSSTVTVLPVSLVLLVFGVPVLRHRHGETARSVLVTGALVNAAIGAVFIALLVRSIAIGSMSTAYSALSAAVFFAMPAFGFTRWSATFR